MSYILDALKKSEKQRQQDHGTPRLHAAQPDPPKPVHETNGRRRWRLPVALLTMGLLGYTIYSISSRTSPSDILPVADNQAPPSTAVQTSLAPAEPAEAADQRPSIPVLQPSAKKVVYQQSVPVSAPSQQPVLENEAEPAPAAAETEKTDQDAPLLDDIDPVVRESIPLFKLAGHVYSPDPQLRMIIINSSVVRENDVVAKGYVIEEITSHGVILRKGDVRFRMLID